MLSLSRSFCLILGLFVLLPFGHAADVDELTTLIQQANEQCGSRTQVICTAGDAGSVSPVAEAETTSSGTMKAASALTPGQTTIKDLNGRRLPISVISEDQIRSLKNLYPSNLRVYDSEVCSQRAQTIGEELGRQGIETVKLVLLPKAGWLFDGKITPDARAKASDRSRIEWPYHVVNLVYVKKADGQIVEYILDPFMESYPVPRAHWEARLKGVASAQVASRYVLDHRDINRQELSYDQKKLERARAIMRGEPKIIDEDVN